MFFVTLFDVCIMLDVTDVVKMQVLLSLYNTLGYSLV